MNSDWINTLGSKAADLDLIASWASQAQLALVRDYSRRAASELRAEIIRLVEQSEYGDDPRSIQDDYTQPEPPR